MAGLIPTLRTGLRPLLVHPSDDRAIASAEALLAHHARTFAFAARFLHPERRLPTIILYAFSRTLDDLVDEMAGPEARESVADELSAWRTWLQSDQRGRAPREPLGAMLAQVLSEYRIPARYFTDLVDGLASDLDTPLAFQTFPQLHRYCYQVASTVGLAMAHVLGSTSDTALAAAADLGTAMQLTNILRDVGADLARNRFYLPEDELAVHGSSHADLLRLAAAGNGPDAPFQAVMRQQITRAHDYYQRGLAGVWLLPPDARPAILVAGRLYRRILTAIERQHYDTLRQRAFTTRPERVREAAIALLLHRLWREGELPAPLPTRETTDAMVQR